MGEEALSPLEQQRGKLKGERWEMAKHAHFVMMPMSSSADSDPTTGGLMLSLRMSTWFLGYLIRYPFKHFFFFFAIIVIVLLWDIQNPRPGVLGHLWKSRLGVRGESVHTKEDSFLFLFWNSVKKITIGTSNCSTKLLIAWVQAKEKSL